LLAAQATNCVTAGRSFREQPQLGTQALPRTVEGKRSLPERAYGSTLPIMVGAVIASDR